MTLRMISAFKNTQAAPSERPRPSTQPRLRVESDHRVRTSASWSSSVSQGFGLENSSQAHMETSAIADTRRSTSHAASISLASFTESQPFRLQLTPPSPTRLQQHRFAPRLPSQRFPQQDATRSLRPTPTTGNSAPNPTTFLLFFAVRHAEMGGWSSAHTSRGSSSLPDFDFPSKT